MKKYKVICLCGSSRFKDDFIKVSKELTLEGKIVLSLNIFSQNENIDIDTKTKKMLDQMHRQKIDMSDEVFVINKNGYIGTSTKNEIEYAVNSGKKVSYLE